jgi:feruloyl-CoA synthase
MDARRAPLRAVSLGPSGVRATHRADGSILLGSPHALGAFPDRLTEKLLHWAQATPDADFLARRDASGRWRTLTYRAALDGVRRIGQALLDRDLSSSRPVAILSGNDLEHALLALACLHVGVPCAPVSPAYSLASRDYARLRHVLSLLTPGLVFAADGTQYAAAIGAACPPSAEIVVGAAPAPGTHPTPFEALAGVEATAAVEAAHAATGPDTVAKVLFTSGSTGHPKGVINTQRMLCCNQEMLAAALPCLREEPPVLVDWLPWNHTFGGNHNLGLVLYNGGTLYIDDGRPLPGRFDETVRNLREIAPTAYFNVPRGFEELAATLRRDGPLRERFFSRVRLLFHAGAALAQPVRDAFDEMALQACGERILWVTGLGATETAPFATCANWDTGRSGLIGLPAVGMDMKLAPVGGKLEARFRGPNVTPGYWRQPELAAACFDEEGYYRMGDAVRFADPGDIQAGLVFDGRLAEDFKLSSGTWVSVGPLRTGFIAACSPLVQDVVITGHDRNRLGALVFARLDQCRALCADLPREAGAAEVLAHPQVRQRFRAHLEAMAANASGGSTRIERLLLLEEPASIDAGEATDKGSINQRAVLDRRHLLVERLHSDDPPPAAICVSAQDGR